MLDPSSQEPEDQPVVPTAAASIGHPEFATAPSLSEFEETLKRLVDRIARILQAEKCVFPAA